VRRLNEAMFMIGEACIGHYQKIKEERRKLDFADLEMHAWRLLTDPEHAAYLHARIDARYRHVLIDEFQDTNPLQWHIVRAWLDAYGEDGDRPSVFIVGDPKQSIYRFRRAEPRVFNAARELLLAQRAADLSTRQTRRNGPAIVGVLNEVMSGVNPLYQPQDTLSGDAHSAVWRLPLVRPQAADGGELADVRSDDAADGLVDDLAADADTDDAPAFRLRNPLTEDPPEDDDSRREREARQVGAALWAARERWQQLKPAEPALKWSDMMILVRSRTHLRAYEAGLRAAHIPFTSSRAGGLLDALEVDDLVALLRWLTMPADDLALAQVMKSPIGQASDDELIALAADKEGSWWQRLQRHVDRGHASVALVKLLGKLKAWLQAAQHLPVHDLLDLVMHEGGLLQAYATATPAEIRAQVLGNLDAFVALSLQLDAGRYPSIARFLDQVNRLRRGKEQEAPDEADVDAALDAVRIMTIHGAKGLEAQVVAIMDGNPSGSGRDKAGVLCEWPEDSKAPTHFSVFGRKAERGFARKQLFSQEEGFRDQENLNLLYVAATRAKHLLIISGVHAGKASGSGLVADSWYQRLLSVDEYLPDEKTRAAHDAEGRFSLRHFDPPSLPAPALANKGSDDNDATREGTLLHALMERLTNSGQWPVTVPAAAKVSRWLGCSFDDALVACEQAQCIVAQPALERFFDPARYRFARNEMEVVHDGVVLRMDRIVIVDGSLWILDYKRNLYDGQRAKYGQQLAQYRTACEQLFEAMPVVTALITSDGKFEVLDSSGLGGGHDVIAAD
jgi:ATP-dependent helicase/nuclease subunit A